MTARILVCFGCHANLGACDDTDLPPSLTGVSIIGLCDDCAPLGQVQAMTRRPKPCPCAHCVYWRNRAQEMA